MNISARLDRGLDPDFLQVPIQVRDDVLAMIAGNDIVVSRRSETDSRLLLGWLRECWRLLPSLTLTQIDGPFREALRPTDYRSLRRGWLAVTAFAKAQVSGSLRLLEAFEANQVTYSLLKGAATAFGLCPQPYHRTSWDFDVGVAKEHLKHAEEIAWDVGFRPAQKNEERGRFEPADPALRAIVESQHYELGFLVRRLRVHGLSRPMLTAIRSDPWAGQFWIDVQDDAPCCYNIVDIHHAISHDIALDQLLVSVRRVCQGELCIRVPSPAWFAAHLIYKIYWEGVHNYGKGLYQYADLVRLVPALDSKSFNVLLEILEQHNMVAAGHYVLRRLPQLGVSLPTDVSDFVAATYTPPSRSDPARLNDLGDMWARLWSQR